MFINNFKKKIRKTFKPVTIADVPIPAPAVITFSPFGTETKLGVFCGLAT